MKRKGIHFIMTILIAVALSLVLPWWAIMVAAFITSLFLPLKKSAVFFVPFLSIAVLWTVHAFYLGNSNDFILAKKISVLFPLNGNIFLLILVTGIIGGIAAGISGVFGKQCHRLLGLNNK
ncbi:MAG: hypothetical protein GW839_00970 [Flavobacteriales bacterium]|nr:hypothetical protein [Flavobacteriia bacterium]NCP52784.1 hypothetical protein [Flavobacteriales bacterium]PJB18532.1 MAG: hypothetical protein CO117_07825 [Flavobacteriaceae bacterium CG_4_9_14_3_um_filter_33_16]NCP58861.1 hypothetical protein [Flavobacteriales bacterium]NCQ14411.1 hypothetical protein [Flavobacteriales bacterium]